MSFPHSCNLRGSSDSEVALEAQRWGWGALTLNTLITRTISKSNDRLTYLPKTRCHPKKLVKEMETWALLPPELIELQIGQIDLLLAVYSEETVVEEGPQALIEYFRQLEATDYHRTTQSRPSIPITLRLPIELSRSRAETLELDLTFPLTCEDKLQNGEPPAAKLRIRQPSWLNRAAVSQITADIPADGDLLGSIEHVKEAAIKQFEEVEKIKSTSVSQLNTDYLTGLLVRVWFYFPSISTRSKRDDFIIHAPTYSLTGFLYAGKPGLLCVEGTSQAIDDYMKFIKTDSWGDIPAHHKKVSERYRETGTARMNVGIERVFQDMSEITDSVGERRGQRVNRGDMKAVEEWLMERGLGEAFAKVLM